MPSSSAFWATPTARAAVWMRALSKVAISCLKPWPSCCAEQVLRRHLEVVEAELVLLHAAVAEHLDLAAGHARRRERIRRRCRAASRRGTSTGPSSPWCSGSVRASSVIRSVRAAWVIQVLLPVIL